MLSGKKRQHEVGPLNTRLGARRYSGSPYEQAMSRVGTGVPNDARTRDLQFQRTAIHRSRLITSYPHMSSGLQSPWKSIWNMALATHFDPDAGSTDIATPTGKWFLEYFALRFSNSPGIVFVHTPLQAPLGEHKAELHADEGPVHRVSY